jgi:hypothetical protein
MLDCDAFLLRPSNPSWIFFCAELSSRRKQHLAQLWPSTVCRGKKHMRNQVVSSLVWLWWVIDLPRFEFEFRTFWSFYLYPCSCRESCLLVSWCVGGRCDMVGSDEDHDRSRRPGAEDRRWWSTGQVLGGQTIGGRVTLCAVCTVHKEMRSTGFLVWPQNQGWWFVSGLTSKPLRRFLPVWSQNQSRRFFPVWPQNRWLRVFRLSLKTDSYGLVIWDSKSPRWFLGLCLKTKWATVYRLCHKTDGRMKTVRRTHRDLAACFTWKSRARISQPGLKTDRGTTWMVHVSTS